MVWLLENFLICMEGSTTRVGLKRFECFYPLQIGLTDFNFFQKKSLSDNTMENRMSV